MDYKRILTIQDISCVGQCSLTVALPVLSACGLETCILPSAVLSTHTGGFTGFTFRDLTDDMPAIWRHWQKENIAFDAVYTGYLGSARQIACVQDIFKNMLRPGGKTIVDPAMADNGRLYTGFDDAYVRAMRTLCAAADVILPNLTEACLLTGESYREIYDADFVRGLLDKLETLGVRRIILTGVSDRPGETGVAVRENGKTFFYSHHRVPRTFHGTGDIYASAFTGAWLRGRSLCAAAQLAADFVVRCIANTLDDESHWYGVKFEPALPDLIHMLGA